MSDTLLGLKITRVMRYRSSYHYVHSLLGEAAHFKIILIQHRASLFAQSVKNLPAMQETWFQLGRSSGKGNGNPFQYPCLENPVDRGAWWAAVHGVSGLGTTERQTLPRFIIQHDLYNERNMHKTGFSKVFHNFWEVCKVLGYHGISVFYKIINT